MIACTIRAVGTVKERHWTAAINEYVKRLQPYMRLRFDEVAPEPITTLQDRERIIGLEGERLLKGLPSSATVIALDQYGKMLTSEELSVRFGEWSQFGHEMFFLIGGTLGLSEAVTGRANATLSLSRMTLTHEMARVFLVEQLYRAMTIQQGKQYHY